MRLLLDAHVSGRAIGRRLRDAGHDVLALTDDRVYDAMDDREVLALATREGRVLVTFNVQDFAPIARDWREEGRQHAGCIYMVGMDHGDFGVILRSLQAVLTARPDQAAWLGHDEFATRRAG